MAANDTYARAPDAGVNEFFPKSFSAGFLLPAVIERHILTLVTLVSGGREIQMGAKGRKRVRQLAMLVETGGRRASGK